MSKNKDIDETAAALADVPEKTKARIAARFATAIVEIKEVQEIPPACSTLLAAGYAALLTMALSPDLEDDATGCFIMEQVADHMIAASGITNGALMRRPYVTVH